MKDLNRRQLLGLGAAALLGQRRLAAEEVVLPEDDGYRGIWYFNQPTGDEHRYKYSGGFATYPQQHHPIACYSREANRTFFVYGGRLKEKNELLHMVSFFDHATGTVPRPRILLNKQTNDAHDNPTLALDDAGHLWIFSNAHGTGRPSYIHRSVRPHSIEAFERVVTTNFSYGQPWHLPGKGFLFLHTRYASGRGLHWQTSRDGRTWEEPRPLAKIAQGHYQVSWRDGSRVGTALNYHPKVGGLNARTNLYYLETRDQGATWTRADGQPIPVPLTEVRNRALVRDYEAEGLLVYLKDLQFDHEGRPVILYLTSKGYAPGPANGPYTLRLARWSGREWEFSVLGEADHNYDFGSLYLEQPDLWRMIGTTEPGPKPFATGGDVAVWTSADAGGSWRKVKQLTHGGSTHSYPRRPLDAHPGFYALWADGDPHQLSPSSLYFTDREGSHVWRLPGEMGQERVRPEIAW